MSFFWNANIAGNELGHFIVVVFIDCTYAGFSYPLGVYILRLFTLMPISHTMHVNTDHQSITGGGGGRGATFHTFS